MKKVHCYRLTEKALDWAVRKILLDENEELFEQAGKLETVIEPAMAYTLLRRNEINLRTVYLGDQFVTKWQAFDGITPGTYLGAEPAIAILRCFVASRSGETIEIPDEFLN
jgi:hypothetical protein